MTNEEWLSRLSTQEKAKFLVRNCNYCSYDCDNDYCSENHCENGIKEWLSKKHIETMPEIKIGDVLSIKSANISGYFLGVVIDDNTVFNDYYGCKEISDPKYTIMVIMNFNKNKKILETVWKRETDDKACDEYMEGERRLTSGQKKGM